MEDAAFLDEVAAFLDQDGVQEAMDTTNRKEATTSSDYELLLASHQLLAETAGLLASSKTAVSNQQEQDVNFAHTSTNSSEESTSIALQNVQISAKSRREVRHAQAAQRRQRHREKIRDEKETLRRQAVELSTHLTSLQAAQLELKKKQASTLMFGAWRAVAARQLERRMQAEEQQKLLRAEVAGKAMLIHHISSLLGEQLKNNQQNGLISCELMETNCNLGGSLLFKTMLEELDVAFARTDDVVHGLEFESAIRVANSLGRKMKEGVSYFENADRTVLPYNFVQAADAVSIVMLSNPDTDFETVNVQDVKDTLTIKYLVKYQLTQGESGSFRVYGAAKKYREKDRLVVIWRTFTEGLGHFEGLQSNDTTWMVARPSIGNCEQSNTVLESYTRLVPTGFGSTSGRGTVDRFVNILAKSGEEEFRQMIETMKKLVISDL
ncbi:hypothetical protein L914_14778 [Phytophthora nicotianae]|uniref:Uncharacterized protein n=2 Tax=Phytophthora nicotianae TaxID=4792 RepID=V9EKH0_PHYNI|nr:hypothetical protein F443_15368 [Phytophthora nicotianae P1569]ETM39027.1 hypothetical protein L914_14778 [Phytophthora nicotianae]